MVGRSMGRRTRDPLTTGGSRRSVEPCRHGGHARFFTLRDCLDRPIVGHVAIQIQFPSAPVEWISRLTGRPRTRASTTPEPTASLLHRRCRRRRPTAPRASGLLAAGDGRGRVAKNFHGSHRDELGHPSARTLHIRMRLPDNTPTRNTPSRRCTSLSGRRKRASSSVEASRAGRQPVGSTRRRGRDLRVRSGTWRWPRLTTS